jgi:hypothetical protein
MTMSRFLASGKFLALVMTLVIAGGIGYWAWSGMKAPPVAAPSAIVTTPPGWVKLDGGGFTLYAPPSAQLRKARGAGFTYGDVIGTPYCIRFQAGPHAGLMMTKKSHPDFSESTLVVDGRPATLRQGFLSANEQQFWFPGCGAPVYFGLFVAPRTPGGEIFVLEVAAANEDARDDIVMMFKSIRFAK